VTPLVADNGDVYYRLKRDLLARTDQLTIVAESESGEAPVVPASEIIHDRMCPLWHPLVGVSPLYACALSATMGNRIQENSTAAFANASRPGGILTAPGHIDDEIAGRLKNDFETKFSGANVGKIAVLGDGLKFEQMMLAPEVMQLIEQLNFTVEDVGRAFHYPLFKLNGKLPPYAGNVEALIMSYYTDCLQILVEAIEVGLDKGLELPAGKGTELDLDNLLRMDTAALFESNNKAVGGGWMAPDEARFRANFRPVPGGGSPMMQQQNWSLAQLAARSGPGDAAEAVVPAAPPETPEAAPAARAFMTVEELEALYDEAFESA
jgi:HK97 family phage portal protein